MLVLTRKKNESILIGDTEVMIVKVGSGNVRLGIIASKDVRVLRKELADKDAETLTLKKIKSYTKAAAFVTECLEDDYCLIGDSNTEVSSVKVKEVMEVGEDDCC